MVNLKTDCYWLEVERSYALAALLISTEKILLPG
jgi:hypothetical protein